MYILGKDEFIHQLGHDLETLLGPLINLLSLIDNHISKPMGKKMLSVIQRSVYYMKNLVKKTLDSAQLNSPDTSFNFDSLPLCGLTINIK